MSISGYDSLKNFQKDYNYVNRYLQDDQLVKYLSQVEYEKATAKQALKDKRHINHTDVTGDGSRWIGGGFDALEKTTFEVVDPVSNNPSTLFDSDNEASVKARWFWDTGRYNLGEAKTYWAAYSAYFASSNELLDAKADLEDHNPIDPSIADLNASDSTWKPDNSPDPDSPIPPGKAGGLSSDNFWDGNNPNSVKSRMFWNTRRFTHEQAFHYAAIYKQPSIIDRNKAIEAEWNKLPIYKQDQIHKENFPADKEGVQRYTWQKNFDAAVLKATKEISNGSLPTKQEYETIQWSPVNDVDYIKFGGYTDKSNPHSPNYDAHYDPNNPAYDKNLDDKYGAKTVVQLLSESKKPYTVVFGRVFWDTGRFTAAQADKYLNNKGYIEPYKKPKCVIDPWNETPSDILRYLLDYLSCSFGDFRDALNDLLGFDIETGVLVAAIVLLIGLGYVAYNNRKQIKLAAITSGSYASHLIPGKNYYDLKKQVAQAEGTSVSYQIGLDAKQAYNPVGLIGKVSTEYSDQNPDTFTAGLLK